MKENEVVLTETLKSSPKTSLCQEYQRFCSSNLQNDIIR